MSSFDERYEKVLTLTRALAGNQDRMVDAAVSDLHFTVKDSAHEVEVARDRLKMYEEAQFLRHWAARGRASACCFRTTAAPG